MSNNNEVTNVDLTLRLGVPSQENSERVADHAANEQVNRAPAPPPPPPRRRHNADDGKVCIACGTTDTPLWRKGPNGPQTLCNACGLKYARTVRRGAQ